MYIMIDDLVEADILFERAKNDLCLFVLNMDNSLIMEKSYDITDSFIDKIRKGFEIIKNKIEELISNIRKNKTIEKVEEAIKENPEIKNENFNIKDYEKLEKLNNDTHKEIMKAKTKEEVDERLKKYREQRNILLASTAVVTVSLSSIIYFLKTGSKKKINNLKEDVDKLENDLKNTMQKYNKLKDTCKNIKYDNKKLKNELELAKQTTTAGKVKVRFNQVREESNEGLNSMIATAEATKAKTNAIIEVIQNTSHDILNNTKDAIDVVKSPNSNVLNKTSNVLKNVSNSASSINDAVSGKTIKKVNENKKEELKKEIQELLNKCKKAKSILDDPKSTHEKKEKAKKFLSVNKTVLDRKKALYDKLYK